MRSCLSPVVLLVPQVSAAAANRDVRFNELSRDCATILLLPASAERFVQLDQAAIFISPGSCERQFGAVKRPLSVEYFEVCRRAALVAKRRNADGFLQIRHRVLLACPDLMKFFVTDKRVRDLSKSVLDRFPVADQSLLVLRLGQMQIPFQRASGKDWLVNLRAIGPDA
jgi:hypothetical protein